MNRWRLLRSDDPTHPLPLLTEGGGWGVVPPRGDTQHSSAEAEWNMRYDADLLEGVRTNALPPTLRLYQWRRPAITVGRFQNIERTIKAEFCQQKEIPIVRRMTGGRGILHGTDLTIALAVPIVHLLPQGYEAKGVSQVYTAISEVFLRSFAACGVLAKAGREADYQSGVGNCFAVHSRADIVAANGTAKLLGAALHRSGNTILMQASIPRSGDEAILNEAFLGESTPRTLPADFSLQDLEAAIIQNFAANFTISLLISEPIDRK